MIATAPAPDDMVEINIADTGAGIAPEIAAQLFQPLVTSNRQGMGVGLSISRTIVEAHGGVDRATNPGGGTVIFLYSARCDQGGDRRCCLKRRRVCVIDDDDALRDSPTFPVAHGAD